MKVVISAGEAEFRRWADQYAAADADRAVVNLANTADRVGVLHAVREAVNQAGRGGHVILSVGHGAAANGSTGWFTLDASGDMRIDADTLMPQEQSSPSYDRDRDLLRRDYFDVGNMLHRGGIARAVLLTCNVGNAIDFVQRVANDWRVSVLAYRRRVACVFETAQLARLYLFGDPDGQGTNIPAGRNNLPRPDDTNHFLARPGFRRRVPPPMY
jgi:hypothetical protein